MTTPNANSVINTSASPSPAPLPAPQSNAPSQASASTYAVFHPVMPPVQRDESWLKRHKLIITTGGATVASGAAAIDAFYAGKKDAMEQNKIVGEVYDRCRADESFTPEDAIFHLTLHNIPEEKIFDVLTSSSRIPPLPEGKKNCLITVDGKKTVGICDAEADSFAKEVPAQSSQSSTKNNTVFNIVEESINMNEGNSNKNTKVIENGQILVLDSDSFEGENSYFADNVRTSSDSYQPESIQYVLVKDPSSGPNGVPKANSSQHYMVLAILFGVLTVLFGILFVKFQKLNGEEKHSVSSESFENLNSSQSITDINNALNNPLIDILLKSQQKVINLEETRDLLDKKCSLSDTAITEILKNI